MMVTDIGLELWLVDLDKCAGPLDCIERAQSRLAPDDLARAGSIRDAREQAHRLAAYTALRILLERVAGPSVRAAPFTRAPGTKPRLDGFAADFSLSHADGFALIGVSAGPPLGVDLEGLRTVHMLPHRMKEVIAIGAALCEHPLPETGPDQTFLQAWARLEAFSKARGCGLSQTLTDLGARGSPQHRPRVTELQDKTRRLMVETGLSVQDLQLLPNLHAALAGAPSTGPVRPRTFPDHPGAIEQLVG